MPPRKHWDRLEGLIIRDKPEEEAKEGNGNGEKKNGNEKKKNDNYASGKRVRMIIHILELGIRVLQICRYFES